MHHKQRLPRVLAIVAVAALAAYLVPMLRPAPTTEIPNPFPIDRTTQLYPVRITTLPAPLVRGNGGSLEAVGNDLFLLVRTGQLYHRPEDADAFRLIDVPPPLDIAAQTAIRPNPAFGVKSLAITDSDDGLRVYAAHTYVDQDRACNGLALSRLALRSAAGGFAPLGTWDTVWRSTPCIPQTDNALPLASAGAFQIDNDGSIVLSVGDFGFDGIDYTTDLPVAQDPASDYGKVVRIDPETGAARHLARGVRNSSGLAIMSDGRIFEVHHGYRGGDELNLVREGANYGWPFVTYGARYATYDWPLSDTPGRHPDFVKPVFAWSPSPAVSALAEADGAEFPLWQGDLLMGSLKAHTLHRIVFDGNRVVLVEPIEIGARIRDMTVLADGRIAMLFDGRPYIGVLERRPEVALAGPTEPPDSLKPCAVCHALYPNQPALAAPRLDSILKRAIADGRGYPYSPALLAHR
ncbi:MAG: PQQ-dependent sugar dehydrogenase, partial [Pseudomonadota bacterium]